jgi:antitoxin component YwqK of YwqJK toxin-antitoxin module
MRHYIIILISITVALNSFGQSDNSSIYKDLQKRKFYSVDLFYQTINGKVTYELNGKKISKTTYNKYESTAKNMETCCPCILEVYNENDVLICEAVCCTDCRVGYYKEFYANGFVKLHGHYKENPTENWENIWHRRYCSIPDGQWTYFNEDGDTLYSEFWNDGEFVKQVPEQKINEIWKVDLTLDDQPVNMQLTPEQVKRLVMTPKFKNASPIENKFTIEFQISAIGYPLIKRTFTSNNFHTLDVQQILSEFGISPDKKANFALILYDYDTIIGNFHLDIKR